MSDTTIRPGQSIILDPRDIATYLWDWDAENLGVDVTIVSSIFTLTTLVQRGETILTKDNESVVSGSRKTRLRLNATTGSEGDSYELANRITTNESPAQTKERSVFVRIMNR